MVIYFIIKDTLRKKKNLISKNFSDALEYRHPCNSNQIDNNCLSNHMHDNNLHNVPAIVQNDNDSIPIKQGMN
jgi:hypothetical protein